MNVWVLSSEYAVCIMALKIVTTVKLVMWDYCEKKPTSHDIPLWQERNPTFLYIPVMKDHLSYKSIICGPIGGLKSQVSLYKAEHTALSMLLTIVIYG